jgi:hypothetical protein
MCIVQTASVPRVTMSIDLANPKAIDGLFAEIFFGG